MAKNLMVVGTSSNVGKSVLCTALCRILHQDGVRVSPFKAQNMSLNSAVTPSGREIGRSQAVQAEACGLSANEHMNPVLLKPMRRYRSQVILQGRVYETQSAFGENLDGADVIWDAVVESYNYLAARHDVLVIEGAGSPVEMNLKPRDIANMRTAQLAEASVLLVADIDRGGVFASLVGTMQLLTESERARVKGIVVNKFRGDPSLFEDGVQMLEAYTGVPVLGVIPYISDLGIDEEDAVGLEGERYASHSTTAKGESAVRIAIVQLPHMSNFTDFDPLFLEPDVVVSFCPTPTDIERVHAVILPGSKNTMEDLLWLEQTGWTAALGRLHAQGTLIFGVCGGYQMLGQTVSDPTHQESLSASLAGMGLLPVATTLAAEKTTVLVQGKLAGDIGSLEISGYEIHMGVSTALAGYRPFAYVQGANDDQARSDGAISEDGLVMGTYVHGIFENDAFRSRWLHQVRARFGLPAPASGAITSVADVRLQAYDRLADVVRAHLDMDTLYRLLDGVEATTAQC